MQYLEGAKQRVENVAILGLCTDKATTAGLPLQVTLVTTPSNDGVVCCPQAGSATEPKGWGWGGFQC